MQPNTESEVVFCTDRHKVELSELAVKISACAKDAAEASHEALQSAIAAGGHLTKAKDRVMYGKWTAWLRENFKFSQNTANDWMRLYKARKELLDLTKGEKQYMSVQEALQLVGANPAPRVLTAEQKVVKRGRDFIRVIYNLTATEQRKTRELVIGYQQEITSYLKSHGK